jgi:hypothetical protein
VFIRSSFGLCARGWEGALTEAGEAPILDDFTPKERHQVRTDSAFNPWKW